MNTGIEKPQGPISIRIEKGLLAVIDLEAAKDRRSRNAKIVEVLEGWALSLQVADVTEEDLEWGSEKAKARLTVKPIVPTEPKVQGGTEKKTAAGAAAGMVSERPAHAVGCKCGMCAARGGK